MRVSYREGLSKNNDGDAKNNGRDIFIIINLRIIYCFNLLMIIPTLQKNTITEIIYLTLVC